MNFDDFDTKMRLFETAHDHCVLPGIYMVARLDGRSFHRLTKEIYQFEAPFDVRFRDHMVAVVEHLMNGNFEFIYGYTQSDEISLLFRLETNVFHRKLRKLNSVLAGEASAVFSLRLGGIAAFDCRISQLPTAALVRDYFLWRQEDASRNALNAHCYWLLRKEGKSAQTATAELEHCSVANKNELLFQRGINFNDIPTWQKRGIGVYWDDYEKEGFNPKTQSRTVAARRRLHVDLELPMKDAYGGLIDTRLDEV
ncbi:guanylyltransferase [Betaproteobacteria bacterium]|nr:guanylyltransferase [Betaproteobacteria bacterium]GHU02932.1 guanylyltransferase [Betaproteobacteria bacterium]GHU20652.1 guanylyltransferase [Betaproteobacteria bacterium]